LRKFQRYLRSSLKGRARGQQRLQRAARVYDDEEDVTSQILSSCLVVHQ
jgi:hypothetical protein